MFVRTILVGATILGAALVGLQSDHSNSKHNPLADKPDSVRVELTDLPGKTKDQDKAGGKAFKTGKKVRFDVMMTNISDSPVTIFRIDPFYQNRPQLSKDGQLVPYRDDVIELLKSKDKEPTPGRIIVIRLEPGEARSFGTLDLGDWYSPLEPGDYQLTDRNRLVYGGQWTTDSSPITFEVSADQH